MDYNRICNWDRMVMKKAILILALMMPLSAQSTETDIEVGKDERQRFSDTRNHKTEPIAVRKYRQHRNRRQEVNTTCVCKKVLKKNRTKCTE